MLIERFKVYDNKLPYSEFYDFIQTFKILPEKQWELDYAFLRLDLQGLGFIQLSNMIRFIERYGFDTSMHVDSTIVEQMEDESLPKDYLLFTRDYF